MIPNGVFTKLLCAALQKKIPHRGISARFSGEPLAGAKTRACGPLGEQWQGKRRFQRASLSNQIKRAAPWGSPEGVLGKTTRFFLEFYACPRINFIEALIVFPRHVRDRCGEGAGVRLGIDVPVAQIPVLDRKSVV